MSTTTIPVTITPEAATRIAELGNRHQVEDLLRHIRDTVPALQSIEVLRSEPYGGQGQTGILVDAHTAAPPEERHAAWQRLTAWELATFPREVCWYLTSRLVAECHDGR